MPVCMSYITVFTLHLHVACREQLLFIGGELRFQKSETIYLVTDIYHTVISYDYVYVFGGRYDSFVRVFY